jgi:hypothetical protein
VAASWRGLHNEELRKLYISSNIIRMIKSKRIRWDRHVARMGNMRNAYKIFIRKPGGKRPIGKPRNASGSGYGPVTSSCEHGIEPSDSHKRRGIY